MKVWRSLDEFPSGLVAPVVTIGNFDGVHVGHQRILELVSRRAAQSGGTSLAITFDPHPTRIIAPTRAPRLLTPLAVKLQLIEKSAVDGVLVLPFTLELSRLTAETFAHRILKERVGATAIIVGENFRFGHKHAGDVRSLEQFGRDLGFDVDTVGPVRLRGDVVSSSRIRGLLAAGRMSLAGRLLGRCFSVRERIVPGRQVGRAQTVPTLNLAPYGEMLPARGVYVTETACDGVRSASVTNVGIRPTFDAAGDGERELHVESFLLDATPPAEAKEMEVWFWRRLRDEKKFPSPEALRQQIMRDAANAQAFFRRLNARMAR